MRNIFWCLVLGICLAAVGCSGMGGEWSIDGSDVVGVLMETELGEIRLAVDVDRAPVTSANFLRYVDEGFYDGGQFHRTVRRDNQPNDEVQIEVIQGSANREKGRGYGAIELERTSVTGLKHVDGSVSMARGGPDTATSSFFICIGDQRELDFGGRRNGDGQGFAAFGRVTEGMDVVRKIQESAAEGQNLAPAIGIIQVERMKK